MDYPALHYFTPTQCSAHYAWLATHHTSHFSPHTHTVEAVGHSESCQQISHLDKNSSLYKKVRGKKIP